MPVFHRDIAQYSPEYDRLKLGLPTSSSFKKIVTPTLGKVSDQRKGYAYHLIAERLLGHRIETYESTYQSEHMRRGMIEESEAVEWYEWDGGVQTELIGFVTDDERTMGCSPDRLVGEDGLLEVKCLSDKEHVRALCEGGMNIKHRPQLQGQLYISQRKWVDILLWHRVLPRSVIRVKPDERFTKTLARELKSFNKFIETEMDKIVTAGYVHVPEVKATLREALKASLAADESHWPPPGAQ